VQALTLIIQTLLTVLIGVTFMWQTLWERHVAPLSASAAPRWLRAALASSSTVSVSADALALEGCCAGCRSGAAALPTVMAAPPEVRPAMPAARLAADGGGGCGGGCGAFWTPLLGWLLSLGDPLHARSLLVREPGAAAPPRQETIARALGGLALRALVITPPLFVLFWPIFMGVTAAIWGSDGYNNFPQPELILAVYGFCLAALTTPLLSMAVLFRAERYVVDRSD